MGEHLYQQFRNWLKIKMHDYINQVPSMFLTFSLFTQQEILFSSVFIVLCIYCYKRTTLFSCMMYVIHWILCIHSYVVLFLMITCVLGVERKWCTESDSTVNTTFTEDLTVLKSSPVFFFPMFFSVKWRKAGQKNTQQSFIRQKTLSFNRNGYT